MCSSVLPLIDGQTEQTSLFSPIAAVAEETCDMPPHSEPPAVAPSVRRPHESNVILFFSSCSSLPPHSVQSFPSREETEFSPLRCCEGGRTEGPTDRRRRATCLAGCPPSSPPSSLPPSAVCTLHSRRQRRRRSALQPPPSPSSSSISSPSPPPSHENLGIYLLSHQFQSP